MFNVTLEKLKTDLLDLSRTLSKNDYQLAMPVEEISKHLKIEIVECLISDAEFVITLKVHIQRHEYGLLAAPFTWTKICSIQEEAEFLATSRGQLVAIRGEMKRDRKPYKSPLCFVSRYGGISVLGSICLNKMFHGATI